MVIADTAVRKRAPRMLHSQQRDPMPIPGLDECESAAGELAACQAERDTFAGVERPRRTVTEIRREFFAYVTQLEKAFEAEPELRRLLLNCSVEMQTMLNMLDARP